MIVQLICTQSVLWMVKHMTTNVRQIVSLLKFSAKENVHVVTILFIIQIRQKEALFYQFETEKNENVSDLNSKIFWKGNNVFVQFWEVYLILFYYRKDWVLGSPGTPLQTKWKFHIYFYIYVHMYIYKRADGRYINIYIYRVKKTWLAAFWPILVIFCSMDAKLQKSASLFSRFFFCI